MYAQEEPPPEVTLVVEGEVRAQLNLVFPEVISSSRDEYVKELDDALWGDLERSGIFELLDRTQLSKVDLTGDRKEDFISYRSLGGEVLLEVKASYEGEKIVVEALLYDLGSGKAILGKRYRAKKELVRNIAHVLSDEIVLHFTGKRGVASTTIAFVSDRTGNKEIFLMDADGKNQRQITDHRSISLSPTWSPKMDMLSYVSFVLGYPAIFVIDFATGNKRVLFEGKNFTSSSSFSPNGKQIVFSRSLGGNSEIFIADLESRSIHRLTYSPGIDTNPVWSPNGNLIAFTSSRAGYPNVFVMDVEGTNVRRISFGGNYNDGATWHPSGTKIAYASRRNGKFKIVVTDLALLETKVITKWEGNHESPSFSPDGRWLTYASSRGGGTQIYVTDIRGIYDIKLTEEGNNYSPEWSPYTKK